MKYPTKHNFVTNVHIPVKISCIEVYGSGALWDCEIGINDGVK